MDAFVLTPRNHLEKKTSEIFGFRNCRQHWMIRRLLEPGQASRGATRVHKRVRYCLQKCRVIHVMGAGERRHQTMPSLDESTREPRRSGFERAFGESRGHDPDPGDDGTTLSSRRWLDVMNDRRHPRQKT